MEIISSSDGDEIEEIDKEEFEKNSMNKDSEAVEQDKQLITEPEQDEALDINNEEYSEIEESENENKEISFKLVIRRDGKNSAAKLETICQTDFDNFIKDLYLLIQDHADELVLRSGIGTHLSDERDWKMFLKEYQRLNSNEKEMIFADLKHKKVKSNKVSKRKDPVETNIKEPNRKKEKSSANTVSKELNITENR
ncbi:hypothetical protein C1645_829099, partial [Glomus cerebriforme]